MHIIDINCTGSEQRLLDCPHNDLIGAHTCGSREDASLRCQGREVVTYSMHVPGTEALSWRHDIKCRAKSAIIATSCLSTDIG